MRLLSGGHRPGRLGKCTSSKCRTVFQALVAVLVWYVVRFCVVVCWRMFVESGVVVFF